MKPNGSTSAVGSGAAAANNDRSFTFQGNESTTQHDLLAGTSRMRALLDMLGTEPPQSYTNTSTFDSNRRLIQQRKKAATKHRVDAQKRRDQQIAEYRADPRQKALEKEMRQATQILRRTSAEVQKLKNSKARIESEVERKVRTQEKFYAKNEDAIRQLQAKDRSLEQNLVEKAKAEGECAERIHGLRRRMETLDEADIPRASPGSRPLSARGKQDRDEELRRLRQMALQDEVSRIREENEKELQRLREENLRLRASLGNVSSAYSAPSTIASPASCYRADRAEVQVKQQSQGSPLLSSRYLVTSQVGTGTPGSSWTPRGAYGTSTNLPMRSISRSPSPPADTEAPVVRMLSPIRRASPERALSVGRAAVTTLEYGNTWSSTSTPQLLMSQQSQMLTSSTSSLQPGQVVTGSGFQGSSGFTFPYQQTPRSPMLVTRQLSPSSSTPMVIPVGGASSSVTSINGMRQSMPRQQSVI